MPRAKKTIETTEVVVAAPVKDRKPRTTDVEGRLALADAKIASLEALIERRGKLIAETESILAERKDAQEKSIAALEETKAKRARIGASKETAAKRPGARAAKAAEREKLNKLLEALEASGKSVDDLLETLQ